MRFKTLTIISTYVILIALIALSGKLFSPAQIKTQLQWISPLFLKLNLLFIFAGILLNLDRFKTIFSTIQKKTWVIVGVIVIGSILLTMFVAPRTHRIYYDEDIYLNVGQNITHLKKAGMCNEGGTRYGEYFCNRLEYNKEPNGWPFLISILFSIVGSSHFAIFLLNNVIWGLSVCVVFLIGVLLFEDEYAGVFAALLLSILPEGLRWSNTTAVEPSAALLSGLAVLSMLFFIRYPGKATLFLPVVFLCFSIQFRPESVLIILPVVLIILFFTPEIEKKHYIHGYILLFIALSLPHFLHLYAIGGEDWGAVGKSKIALSYVKENLSVNGLFYFRNHRFPLLLSLFFFIGLAIPRPPGQTVADHDPPSSIVYYWREKIIVLCWFVAFWGVYLIFYAGSYNYGADVRFSLMTYMPIALLAGYGTVMLCKWIQDRYPIHWACQGMTILILFSFISFLPYIRSEGQEAWAARADHQYAEIMARQLPPDALVFTHNPNMFLVWECNALQASVAANEPEVVRHLMDLYHERVFFHYNFWCNVDDPRQKAFCSKILEMYAATPILTFKEKHYEYVLYKIALKD